MKVKHDRIDKKKDATGNKDDGTKRPEDKTTYFVHANKTVQF